MINIKTFKKHDIVTRVEPAKELQNNKTDLFTSLIFGNTINGGDRSYIGDKLIFIGVANGCAYFKQSDYSKYGFGVSSDKLIDLPLDIWSDGWELWIDPKTLLDDSYNYDGKNLNNNNMFDIQKQITKAIEEENYELAEVLKNKLL